MSLLEVTHLTKNFGGLAALSNVDFRLEDNELVGLIGPNGAGKTTLLRIIVGEMPSDSGLVTLAKDKTMGYLAQNSAVDTSNTIYEERKRTSFYGGCIELRRRMYLRYCHQS